MISLFVTICLSATNCGREMVMANSFATAAACEDFVQTIKHGERPPAPYGLMFRCAPDV